MAIWAVAGLYAEIIQLKQSLEGKLPVWRIERNSGNLRQFVDFWHEQSPLVCASFWLERTSPVWKNQAPMSRCYLDMELGRKICIICRGVSDSFRKWR